MKWKQLLCIAVCLLELSGCAAESTTDAPTPTGTALGARDASSAAATTATAATAATAATTATGHSSSAKPTSAEASAGSVATNLTSPELSGQLRTSPQPSAAPTSPPGSSLEPHGSPGVSTTQSPPTQPRDTSGSTVAGSSSAATAQHPPATGAGDSAQGPLPAIGCHGARDEGDTGAVCLQLNASRTCEDFLERKGLDLWGTICENRTHTVASPCEIKLTPSSLDRECLLLILKGEKDPDKLLNALPKSHWEKLGIESLKKESARSPREPSQKTLIALVTSGLLLAFLGLAGYFLMKRRSWSPAGERL
ncbi:hematopoietic progenitor cell antigen CD34 isoform X3 [Hirundo rustica]|nr:hematopoietic progenitor cell antigen CD34 isoform X3 [Hirundo rustica]